VALKQIDGVMTPQQFDEFIGEQLPGAKVARGYRPFDTRDERWGTQRSIAVIPVLGNIGGGKNGSNPITGQNAGAESFIEAVSAAAEDPSVAAIVVRVDSGGGDGMASDLMYRAVLEAKKKKPVIASMGDVAASGGYLAAVGADAIVAEPSTITGSIGVFALKPDLSGLLAKLSVARASSSRGENAEWRSFAKPWTPSERRALEKQLDGFYRMFVERVAEGRKLPRDEAERLAGGRVWTGKQAFDRRLVDRLGSVQDAIALARERARLGPDAWVEVRRTAADPGDLGDVLAEAAADVAAQGQPPLARAAAALPEVRVLALLERLGPVVALPVDWVQPVP
jgi:protease-4